VGAVELGDQLQQPTGETFPPPSSSTTRPPASSQK